MGGSRIYVVPTGLTLNGTNKVVGTASECRQYKTESLVLFGDRSADIDGWQHGENIRLNNGNKDVQSDERDGNDNREDREEHAENRTLGPSPLNRADEQA